MFSSKGEKPAPAPEDRVVQLAISSIYPDPMQSRTVFEPDKLRQLTDSIAELGVITPLCVRRVAGGYQLVSGERRLRAAAMAGFTHVPCLVTGADIEKSAYMALVENLQRCDLDCFEEAAGLARLITEFGITQEEAARRVGKSQSAVANKLRLLRLNGECVAKLRSYSLGERHARALLRLPAVSLISAAIDEVGTHSMTVAETEKYVEQLLRPASQPPARHAPRNGTRPPLIRDARLLINSLAGVLKTARAGGLDASLDREELPDSTVLRITIPKKR